MSIGLEPEEYQRLLLSIGTHRQRRVLTPVEVGALLAKAVAQGYSRSSIATAVGITSTEVIRRFLLLSKLDPAVQSLVGWGRQAGAISFANAAEIARLPIEEHMAAAQAILENRLGNAEVEELVQIRTRSGVNIEAAIEAVLRRRPTVERHYLFVGQLSPSAAARLEDLERDARDRVVQRASSVVFRDIARELQVRTAKDRVTIFSTSDVRDRLGTDFDVRLSQQIVQNPDHAGQ